MRYARVALVGDYDERVTAHAGVMRSLELAGHPFFIATLFQPERAALSGEPHPLVRAFVAALR